MQLPPPDDSPERQLPSSIALHIGAHKTASTHLQKVLLHNRDLLSQEGIRFYGPGFLRKEGRDLATMFGLSSSKHPKPRRDPHAQLRYLAKGCTRLVFSEENFVGSLMNSKGNMQLPVYPSAPQRVAELVSRWAPVETKLYVSIRNPASFMASAFSQSMYGRAHIGPRTFRDLNDWRDIDWADYISKLRVTAGLGQIFVWRQEDYESTQRLILRRLLRWKVGAKIETLEGRINQGLSTDAVRQALQWVQDGKTGSLAQDARDAFPVGDLHKPFGLYPAYTLAASKVMYDEQFAQIAAMDGVTVLRPG